jgi:hypothetical protein
MTSRPIRLAGLLLGALLASACGSQAPASAAPSLTTETTSADPAPAAGTAFASTRYGYRIRYPDGWTVDETPGSGGVHPDEPGVDTFRDRTGHILSVVGEPASAALDWTCAIVLHLEGSEHRLTPDTTEQLRVAGQPATLFEHHLEIKPYVVHYLTVQVLTTRRGLTLSLESTTGDDGGDRQVFDDLLATLELGA